MIEKAETAKRKYTRRSPEEIAAEKAAKEERRLAREQAKAEKEASKTTSKNKEIIKDTPDDTPESPAKHEPSKRVAAKKSNGQKVVIPERGQWSDCDKSVEYHTMHVEIEVLEDALGTSPNSKDLLGEYIASKAPDALSKEEEIAVIGENEMVEKGTTVFPRGHFNISKNGHHLIDVNDRKESVIYRDEINKEAMIKLPFFWNYQLRGFFKDSCGLLSRANYGESADLKAYKKVIDGNIFVSPRRIAIDLPETYINELGEICYTDPDNLPILSRPLMASTAQGTMTTIARSEVIPAGSRIKFCIKYLDPKMKPTIIEWLNYGCEHGLGAWRNSGRGIFRWREINEDYSPISE